MIEKGEFRVDRGPGRRLALYPNLDNPESFNEQVLSFLADVDARPTT
ncbi:hypothetical protein [Leekyejoonella antrihumi]|nr:hypothetical protein [Leekyejoonella antrihumi]